LTRRFVILAALAAALALPVRAGADTAVTLKLKDGFVVKGTSIVCAVELSKTLLPGEKIVECFIATRQGPVPKTYSVVLAVNGEVVLGRVASKKGDLTIVMKRGGGPVKKQSDTTRQGRVYQAKVGSAFLVKGTAITCAVAKQKFGGKDATTIACFKVNRSKKPRPNTFGIGITDGGAFLVHFNAKSKGSPVKVVEHGR
jgi:hypothetical protein